MLQAEEILRIRVATPEEVGYRLIQRLGQNASRQTWLAEDLQTHESVVLKLLTFTDQVEWDDLRLFEREAQILRQLHHSHIPQYRDFFCLDEQMLWFGLVQQHIPGESLKAQLATGYHFTEERVQAIATEILDILIYLHNLSPPVLHRDIKPSNLILAADGSIYLVDFGAVQDRAAREGATFTVVGTYGYAPLEQLGGRATPASDLYALGATLIHLLTGIAPADLPQVHGRMLFSDRTSINPAFLRWLQKLTEPNLDSRFDSAQTALDALQIQRGAIAPRIARPSRSSIRIQSSPERLAIRIPKLGWRAILSPKTITISVLVTFVFWYFRGLLLFTSLSTSLFLLIQGVSVIIWVIYILWLVSILFGETVVVFDHRYFDVQFRVLGICLRRQRGDVLDVERVFKGEFGVFTGYNHTKVPEVTLAVGVHEYVFGAQILFPLTEVECVWLVQEINHWLGI